MKNPLTLTEEERLKEWADIEDLVAQFQEARLSNNEKEYKQVGDELITRFSPLFKKYVGLLKHGNIDYTDVEMKNFVWLFIEDYELRKALCRKKQSIEYKKKIHEKFMFVVQTYGQNFEEDILSDLHMCFLIMANRYKRVGKNFCAYVHNVFRHEIGRHIKNFIKNPLNITYKNYKYEDCVNGDNDAHINLTYEDNYYESITGLPDFSWISGQSCGDMFSELTTVQRKIIVKYYLEEWNDRQIADSMSIHINTVNYKRREAIDILCSHYGIHPNDLRRSRRSGRKATINNNPVL